MAKKIEIEEKYFCDDHKGLKDVIKKLGFEKKKEEVEIDEYFTDINGEYVKNRTCLRIRTNSSLNAELTFKGKSKSFGHFFVKGESNVNFSKKEKNDMVEMLEAIGFHSYTIVDKKRITFEKEENGLVYSILIDTLKNIGDFVEFEILSDQDYDVDFLKKNMEDFMKNFENLNFEVAKLPYRDYVAKNIFKKISGNHQIKGILFDLDGTLINSEKAFFNSFKKVLKDIYGTSITESEYVSNELEKNANLIKYLKENNRLDASHEEKKIMENVYSEYEIQLENLLKEADVVTNFELIKKIKEKGISVSLVTTSPRRFINILEEVLEIEGLFDQVICREDVEKLKPDPMAYSLAINNLPINKNNLIAIEDSPRGIISAKEAGLEVIKVTNYSLKSKKVEGIIEVDSVARLLLILLNYES